MSRAEIYQDKAGQWRWRLTADNGETVASGESYRTKRDAQRGLQDMIAAADQLDREQQDPSTH